MKNRGIDYSAFQCEEDRRNRSSHFPTPFAVCEERKELASIRML
jgi:hypothetical protein